MEYNLVFFFAITLFMAYGISDCQPWNWDIDPGGFLIQRPDQLKWGLRRILEFGGNAVVLVVQPKPIKIIYDGILSKIILNYWFLRTSIIYNNYH